VSGDTGTRELADGRPSYRLVRREDSELGKALPGGSAYTYLPASVRRFPDAESLAALLDEAGFATIRYRFLAGGIVALHTGEAA